MGEIQENNWRWEADNCNPFKRFRYAKEKLMWTDCTFSFNENSTTKTLHCHRLLLAQASPVFEAMLYGTMAPLSPDNPIHINIHSFDTFQDLLKFVYSESHQGSSLNNILEGELTLTRVKKLYEVAHMYMVNDLLQVCHSELMKLITYKVACEMYEFAYLMGNETMQKHCFKIIKEKTSLILDDPSFFKINRRTLTMIVNEEDLNIASEAELISAVISWGVFNKKNQHEKSVHDVLGPEIVCSLNFLAVSKNKLFSFICGDALFTKEERAEILQYLNISSDDKSDVKKVPACLLACGRVRRSILVSHDVTFTIFKEYGITTYGNYQGNYQEYVVCFTVNKDAVMVGILTAFHQCLENQSNEFKRQGYEVYLRDEEKRVSGFQFVYYPRERAQAGFIQFYSSLKKGITYCVVFRCSGERQNLNFYKASKGLILNRKVKMSVSHFKSTKPHFANVQHTKNAINCFYYL